MLQSARLVPGNRYYGKCKLYGKIVMILKGMHLGTLDSYSSSPLTSFPLSSSSFNHPWLMHSVHSLLYLNLERSTFIGLPPIAST